MYKICRNNLNLQVQLTHAMRKVLFAFAIVLLASCTAKKSDVEVITDFYNALLGGNEMTDELLKESLSEDLLSALWESQYENTYSSWELRSGYQDGISEDSSLESVEPLGDGWYQVLYTDMGFHAVTDVKMVKGKIDAYRPFRVPYAFARGYFFRNDVSDELLPNKITSQEELLQYFGMATVMGENGKPTEIDFEKSFVVPIVFPETDQETSIVIDRFWHNGPDVLTLVASAVRDEQHRKFTIRPVALLVVDNGYANYAIDLQVNL